MPIPLRGDRSAWDDIDYPDLHSRDLDENTPTHHLPYTSGSYKIPYWESGEWTSISYSVNSQFSWVVGGALEVSSGATKVPNRTGVDRTIVGVWLDITTPPTGDVVVVDIKKDGTTIFTNPANRPQIEIGQSSGYTEVIDVSTWENGAYYTWQIVGIGSTNPGSDLTITVVYR